MKKNYRLFFVFTAFWAGGVSAGAVCLARISGALCLGVVIAGAAVWAILFARFRSIEYAVENSRIIIRRGVLFRSETALKISGILWITTVKFGSVELFSVLHTASGRVIVFAELDPDILDILPRSLDKAQF